VAQGAGQGKAGVVNASGASAGASSGDAGNGKALGHSK
jgi:hypothetical protein